MHTGRPPALLVVPLLVACLFLAHTLVLAAEEKGPQPGGPSASGLPAVESKGTPPPGSTLYMGVQEAVRRAINNSPDLRAAGYLPLKAAQEVESLEGKNDPVGYTKGNYTSTDYPTTTPTLTGTTQRLSTASLGLKQLLNTGTYYDFSWDSSYNETDFTYITLNPAYRADFSLTVTQPLLKGFGLAVNRAPAEVARNAQKVAEIQYRSQAEDLVQRVMETYWDLVLAREIATVKISSLELARNLARSIERQVQSGLLAPVELYKAQTVEATREEEVLLARKGASDIEDLLKSLIAGQGSDSTSVWDSPISPVDRPEEKEIAIDEERDLAHALENRDEIRQAEADRNAKIEALRIAANALLPSLNVIGGLKLNGLSGRAVATNIEKSCASTPDPEKCVKNLNFIFGLFGFNIIGADPQFVGDYWRAYDNMDFLTWYVGFNLEYPFGNNAGNAKYQQALIDLARSASQMASLRDKIRVDVREAARRLETNRQRLETTAVASRFAEKSLGDEQKKFDQGYSTTTQVLTTQKDLAEARSSELKARADYAKAILRYQAASGTLLEESGIRPPTPEVGGFDTPNPLW